MAGLRIGFATGPRELIGPMLKVKLPFEPSTPAQAAGLGALEDHDFLRQTIETNRIGKAYLAEAFRGLGLRYVETAANFFCVPMANADEALALVLQMERRGVIIRPLGGFGLADCIRISIGTPAENEKAARALGEALKAIGR